MVMAAGYGTRLRPLTDAVPKPMIPVRGRPIIDDVLDRLVEAGIRRVVVNLHHRGEVIEAHLVRRTDLDIAFSRESEIQDTGGGVRQALPLLGAAPFFVVNAKIIWRNGRENALLRLARAWDGTAMDALLLLHPAVDALGYEGQGDFFMDQLGRVRRRRSWEVSPFVFTGIQIVHPRLFDGAPPGPFSMNLLWDRAIAAGRLQALRHDGQWFQMSTPRQLELVEKHLGGTAPAGHGR
ncbi:MAG: nucleotidyltransferase family protein [Rhodospirillaceae bacterium]|nr:nucleotidyltransferase family protein [Rhodospirillaceae bacterium]